MCNPLMALGATCVKHGLKNTISKTLHDRLSDIFHNSGKLKELLQTKLHYVDQEALSDSAYLY